MFNIIFEGSFSMKFLKPFVVASTLICLPSYLVASEQFSYVTMYDGIKYWDSPVHWQQSIEDYLSTESKISEYVAKKEGYVKQHEKDQESYLGGHNILSWYWGGMSVLPIMWFVAPIVHVANLSLIKTLMICGAGCTISGAIHYSYVSPYPKGFLDNQDDTYKKRLHDEIKTEIQRQDFLTKEGFYPRNMGDFGIKVVNKFIDSVMTYDKNK